MILRGGDGLALPAAIAAVSRFSGGVRIRPQNTGVIAGP